MVEYRKIVWLPCWIWSTTWWVMPDIALFFFQSALSLSCGTWDLHSIPWDLHSIPWDLSLQRTDSSCGSGLVAPYVDSVPPSGIEPASQGEFFTPGPSGKSQRVFFQHCCGLVTQRRAECFILVELTKLNNMFSRFRQALRV